ncbi:hypothetical protein NUSPORA_02418 [Nucleospora cyclopteri]
MIYTKPKSVFPIIIIFFILIKTAAEELNQRELESTELTNISNANKMISILVSANYEFLKDMKINDDQQTLVINEKFVDILTYRPNFNTVCLHLYHDNEVFEFFLINNEANYLNLSDCIENGTISLYFLGINRIIDYEELNIISTHIEENREGEPLLNESSVDSAEIIESLETFAGYPEDEIPDFIKNNQRVKKVDLYKYGFEHNKIVINLRKFFDSQTHLNRNRSNGKIFTLSLTSTINGKKYSTLPLIITNNEILNFQIKLQKISPTAFEKYENTFDFANLNVNELGFSSIVYLSIVLFTIIKFFIWIIKKIICLSKKRNK